MRKIAPLHPEAKQILATIAELERGIVAPLPVAEMRAVSKRRAAHLAPELPAVGRIENRRIETAAGGVPVRFYYPPGSAASGLRPAYIYAHGGGFAVGDLDMVEPVCRSICRDANIVVASVDYRLAPEHKFPAGLDDMIAVSRWIGRHGADVGIDVSRLAIGGDSAGGNLAAAAAQAMAGKGEVALRYQVLVYPVTDLTCQQPSYTDLGTGYPLTADRMKAYIKLYLNDPAQARDARASPLLAASLSGQPPALVVVAGLDPLVDEGIAYAKRLQQAGVAAEIHEVPDHPHGFLGWSRDAKAARDTLALIGRRLGEQLHA
ncbi:MAG: alpha/beta hydrolase [Hyphomicrobiaceae bacterium]